MKKPRVLIAGLFHETHTFLDGLTPLSDFQIRRGEELWASKGDSSPLGGVLELADEFDGNAYRSVYAVRFHTAVYVLHCFQKKSRQGIKTPLHEIDLIKRRLREAEADHAQRNRERER